MFGFTVSALLIATTTTLSVPYVHTISVPRFTPIPVQKVSQVKMQVPIHKVATPRPTTITPTPTAPQVTPLAVISSAPISINEVLDILCTETPAPLQITLPPSTGVVIPTPIRKNHPMSKVPSLKVIKTPPPLKVKQTDETKDKSIINKPIPKRVKPSPTPTPNFPTVSHGKNIWYQHLDYGIQAAKAGNKLLLVKLWFDGCIPCKNLGDDLEKIDLSSYVCVEIDIVNDPVYQRRYSEYKAVPTLIVASPDGKALKYMSGYKKGSFTRLAEMLR